MKKIVLSICILFQMLTISSCSFSQETGFVLFPRQYTITYEVFGICETPEPSKTLINGQLGKYYPKIEIPDGYRIEGWYLDEKFLDIAHYGYEPKGDVTLYANWKRIPRVSVTGYDDVDLMLCDTFNAMFKISKTSKVDSVGKENVEYGKYSSDTVYVIEVVVYIQRAGRNFHESLIKNLDKIFANESFENLNQECKIIFYYCEVDYNSNPNLNTRFEMYVQNVKTYDIVAKVVASTQLDYASLSTLTLTDEEVNSIYDAYWEALGTTRTNT